MQRDPIEYGGGSVNLYEYVASAPLLWLDPLGLQWVLGLHSDTGASGGSNATDGHAWLTLSNTNSGAHLSYGLWPDGHPGIQQAGLANGPGSDVRVNYEGDLTRPPMDANDAEIYWDITDEQAQQVIKYANQVHLWEYRNNCSRFAGKCIETVLGIRVEAYDGRVLFFRTPTALARWIKRELKKREAEEKRKKLEEERKKKKEEKEKDGDTCEPKDPSDSGPSDSSGSGKPPGSS